VSVQEPPTKSRPREKTSCPTCEAPAERGQLICLECGSRIALAYRRPPSWKIPVAIVAGIVLVSAVAFAWGLRAVTDDAEKEVAAQPAPPPAQPKGSDGGEGDAGQSASERAADRRAAERRERDAERRERAAERRRAAAERRRAAERRAERRKPKRRRRAAVAAGGVRTWPKGKDAFTVIILSTPEKSAAQDFAKAAAKGGVPAGVLRADDYPSLKASTGFWIVYVGRYKNQARADRATARYGRRYPGAYPQFVNGSKAKR
jgi:septal ring-binding cell division protein DamX